MTSEVLERLQEAIKELDAQTSKALTKEAVEGGVDPQEIVGGSLAT